MGGDWKRPMTTFWGGFLNFACGLHKVARVGGMQCRDAASLRNFSVLQGLQ